MQIFYLYFCLLFAIVIHVWHSKVGPQVCECKPLLKLSMYHLNNGLVDIFVTKNIRSHTECVQKKCKSKWVFRYKIFPVLSLFWKEMKKSKTSFSAWAM